MPSKYGLECELFLPEYIHFWYEGLSDEEKEIADLIMMSMRALHCDTN